MEFRVLGPVEAEHNGARLRLGGPKQRALLAFLLLRANTVVSRDQLIDGLWGDRPPASAGHTLEDYVSRLRKVLGGDRIATRSPGYVLRLDDGELDLQRFDRLVEQGSAAFTDVRPADAAQSLSAALDLWRGPALADVVGAPLALAEAARLEDRRVSVLERLLEARLAAGDSSELVGDLETLVRTYPSRERFVYLLMLALYRSGRQSSALDAYRDARRRLVDDLGLEPGSDLQELQQQILTHDPVLTHDPALEQPASGPPAPPAQPRRRRRSLYAIASLAAIAGLVVGIMSMRDSEASPVEATSSRVVAVKIGSTRPMHEVELASAPAGAAADAASVWLAEPDAAAVTRVDVSSGSVVDRIGTPGGVGSIAVGAGSVWATVVLGSAIVRIDPQTGTITQRVALAGIHPAAVAFGRGALWVADPVDNALLEIDPHAGSVRRTVQLALRPTALAYGKRTIWVADYDAGLVAEVDPQSGATLATVHVGNGPGTLAVGADGVWVTNSLDSTLTRIDPRSDAVAATIPVGSGPAAVVIAGGSVWTADRFSGVVTRVDPVRNAIAQQIRVGGAPTTLSAVGGTLWVGVQPRTQRRGGTLRLLSSSPLSIDPAIQVHVPPPQTGGLTTDGLVTYNHVGGPAGLQLVPDLAIALPAATDGGRTYTFRLRPGIRYSDGRLVRSSDFRRAFERLVRFRSDSSDSFRGVLGASGCIARPVSCDLSKGIVTNDAAGTVTFHLGEADPNFLGTLAYGSMTAPVPPGTPMRSIGFTPIPGTGPYKVASASREKIRYVRNPYFREWSHAARPDGNPDRIVMRFGLTPEQEVRSILNGEADWMVDSVPTQLLPTLQRRHAGQLRSYATPQTDWLQINTRRPPFDDVRVRRALNFAIDRRIAVRSYGGPVFATLACQVLPPGVSGYRPYCPYTANPASNGAWTAPDLARARRLVRESGTRGARVTVWGLTDDCCLRPALVEHTARVLRQLGYRAGTRYSTHAAIDLVPARVRQSIQLIPVGWTDQTADNFFTTWFSCDGAGNKGAFCSSHVDRQIREAKTLAATDPHAAAARWAAIDRELVDLAAAVPLFNERWIEFVSPRVRNFQHNPIEGFLAAQAALR